MWGAPCLCSPWAPKFLNPPLSNSLYLSDLFSVIWKLIWLTMCYLHIILVTTLSFVHITGKRCC